MSVFDRISKGKKKEEPKEELIKEEEPKEELTKAEKSELFDNDLTPTKRLNKRREIEARKETKKESNNDTDFNFDDYPVIALLWGQDGTSKSEQIMKFEPKEHTLIFDLEDKLRPLASKLKFPQANIITAKKYNEKYDVSGPRTLQGIRDIIKEVKKNKQDNRGKFKHVQTIGFDGISDIRKPYAVLEWLKDHPERQKPMNWGDWGEINDKVKDICFGLINLGIITNTNIFFTAQIDWKDDKEVPDCKPWIWHNIQHKFKMTRDDENHKFYGYCEKSHHDPFFKLDLTDFTHAEKPSLLNMLKDPKLLEIWKKKSMEELDSLAENKLNQDVFN